VPSEWIFEANDRDFETAVIERSKQVPVVVDFWAPWCAPCRMLGPVLERLAEEFRGEFLLAKVNVDENPGLAQAFRIQSIPFVIGLREGEIVSEFTGAVPESSVRQFLERILPTAADREVEVGRKLLAEGQKVGAEEAFRRALERDPRHGGALVGLARAMVERGEIDEALRLLEQVGPGPFASEAEHLAATLRVRRGRGDVDALRARVAQTPGDLESRLALARACAASGLYGEALEHYLEVVRRDREYQDQAARKAMLDIFELLGPEHPLTTRYRSELAKVLFA